MNSAGNRTENNLYVIRSLMERDRITFQEALERYPGVVPADERDALLALWESRNPTTIRILRPMELSEGGPRPWFEDWDTSNGYYWARQRGFLVNVLRRDPDDLESLDTASDRVLAHLEDPSHPEPFTVYGLVVGHVQSGKTANFSAVIAKAADAGYKIVIVLSGLHNTLRQQTQRRLQRDLGDERYPGVGQGDTDKWWTWMTDDRPDGDFNPQGANAGFLQGHNHVILVVKKNKSRLDRLLVWMRGRVPGRVPVLVIDDEADQASINTGGNRSGDDVGVTDQVDLTADDFADGEPAPDELDPSAINYRIRQLVTLFQRCSYVGYTATPYANVLINPAARDHTAGADLFPQHFIIGLPPPPVDSYVGAERLFGRDEMPGDPEEPEGMDVIRTVPDHEVGLLVPPNPTPAGFQPTLAPSLRTALLDYLLASAGWLARSGTDQPCTMLLHTDMRKAVQDRLAAVVEEELTSLRRRWRYDRSSIEPELRTRWDQEFRRVTSHIDVALDRSFDELLPHLGRLLNPGIPVLRLNSDHLDTLDFDAQPTLKAVLVGGNKLSRGVTIEGLMVSFYVRRSPYYDTLFQMGRWFGYRGAYVDLTRLYSTQLLIEWFHDLATIEADLRRQIAMYALHNYTPLQLAPRIRSHDFMAPTAKNKSRDSVQVAESFDGRKLQTLRFPFGTQVPSASFASNLGATRELVAGLGPPSHDEPGEYGWHDVPAGAVQQFVEQFQVYNQANLHPTTLTGYIQDQIRLGELVRWHVLVKSARRENNLLGTVDLHVRGHPQINMIERSRKASDPTSLGVVTEPADEKFGLTAEQVERADYEHEQNGRLTRDEAYRSQRNPQEGLLVIYPISPRSQPGRNARMSSRAPLFEEHQAVPECVVAYAISFPMSASPATVEYIAASGGRRP